MGVLKFGKSSKGKVIHVIILEKTAMCDKKQTGLVVDKSLGPKDVTCAKCQRYAGFKSVLADQVANDVLIAEDALDAAKKDKKKVQKEKKTKVIPVKVVPAKEPVLDFQKEKKTDGSFQIIHVPSGLHFFDKIEKEVVDRALSRLNKIEVKWETETGNPPRGFISQCRKALRIAYKQAGIEIPDGLIKQNDPVEEVKKTKKDKKAKKEKIIKKKEKKSKKTIKRRDKKPSKETKSKKKSKRQIYYDFIYEWMVHGINISELVDLLVKEFGLSAKKANSKVKGNIRRMRRKGIEIVIRLTEKKEDDFYEITG